MNHSFSRKHQMVLTLFYGNLLTGVVDYVILLWSSIELEDTLDKI